MRIQCVTVDSTALQNHTCTNKQASACKNKIKAPSFGFWYPAMEKRSMPMALDTLHNIIRNLEEKERLAKMPPPEIQNALANVSNNLKPKNGIWLKGLKNMNVDTSKFEKYQRMYKNIKGYSGKVLRTICTQNKGEVVYIQDEYPKLGKLVTQINTKGKDGTKTLQKIEELLVDI